MIEHKTMEENIVKENKEFLEQIKNLVQQFAEQNKRLTQLETVNEQLNAIVEYQQQQIEQLNAIVEYQQQQIEQLREISELALILSLVANSEHRIKVSENEKDNYKIKYFSRVVLAKMIGDKEDNAHIWGQNAATYNFENGSDLFKNWYSETENKSVTEIVMIIKQMMTSSTKQYKIEGLTI